MTDISWSVFSDAAPDSFNVYRSIAGITINFPNSIATNDIFIFQATNKATQKVVIGATDIASVAAAINAGGKGVRAAVSNSGTELFIRVTARHEAKLKVMPCGFATHAGITTGLYTAKQNFTIVGNVPYVALQYTYMYADADGDPFDWYRLTAVTASVEGLPSIDQQALIPSPDICVVEGRITNMRNEPIIGALVDAHIQIPGDVQIEDIGVVTRNIQTLTDDLGRWSLPMTQGQLVLFQIEAIGYNEVLSIPLEPFVLFNELKPDDGGDFTPGGDPIAGAL